MANGTLKVSNIQTSSGSGTITLGQSGETIALGSGVTSKFNQPAFEANLSANQSIADNTTVKVEFDREVFDTDNCYDNSTNYRFTPTKAGKYFVYSRLQLDAQSASNFQQGFARIYKNGSIYTQTQMNMASNQPENIMLNVHAVIDMNGSSDYLEIFGHLDDTSGTPLVRGTTFVWSIFGAYRMGVE